MIIDQIVTWNVQRNNLEFDIVNEATMLQEELQELVEATNYSDMIDALCDLVVVAIGGIHKLGYDPTKCMEETLKEINSRQQDPTQKALWLTNGPLGKWEKDRQQDPASLYKANYEVCVYG